MRINWKTVSTLVTTIVVAGCMENGVSSPQVVTSAPAPMMMAPEGHPSLSLKGNSPSNTSGDFTVGQQGGLFFVGNHAVYFPAHSICDPATSSYGEGTWDAPCDVVKGSVRIHAEVRTAKLGTWVDFTPSLRFAPSTNPNKWVWIYMYTPSALGAADLSKFGVLYAKSMGAPGVDEASTDATLRTYVDTFGGLSSRRIKHFSGFMTSSGKSCDPETEADCYPRP